MDQEFFGGCECFKEMDILYNWANNQKGKVFYGILIMGIQWTQDTPHILFWKPIYLILREKALLFHQNLKKKCNNW